MQELFRKFSQQTSRVTGSYWAFLLALSVILLWISLGPVFNFSDTWQLVINTSTTIITFLMVFLIQNSQNRDSKIINVKLDELLRSEKMARNALIDIENLTDAELDAFQAELVSRYGSKALEALRRRLQKDVQKINS